MVYNWTTLLSRVIYPSTCLLCGGKGENGIDLCPDCRTGLPHNSHPCPCCAEPLPPGGSPEQPCGACLRAPPPFDRCIAPLLYDYQIGHLVTGLKFRGKLVNARLLSQLLADHLVHRAAGEPRPDTILPVPLHDRRLRERGFNQALEIARPLAARLAIPITLDSVVRGKATAPQSSLEKGLRRRNMRGAFTLTGPLQFRHVALVDDVVTTGNTVAELAGVLKRAGVERVDVWAVAKTPADGETARGQSR